MLWANLMRSRKVEHFDFSISILAPIWGMEVVMRGTSAPDEGTLVHRATPQGGDVWVGGDVVLEFGEELVEGELEGGEVAGEVVDGGGEFGIDKRWERRRWLHAGRGQADAVGGFVAGEPVVHGHEADGVVAACSGRMGA